MMVREFDEAKEMLRAALGQSKHEQSFVVLGKVIIIIMIVIITIIIIIIMDSIIINIFIINKNCRFIS